MSTRRFISCLFIFAGFMAGIWAVAPRWFVWLEQRRQASDQVERMQTVEKQREGLIRTQARSSTKLGKEAIARGQGWLKPGETPAE